MKNWKHITQHQQYICNDRRLSPHEQTMLRCALEAHKNYEACQVDFITDRIKNLQSRAIALQIYQQLKEKTHIGLFEGIGGFSLAARWAGYTTIAWCEWNPFCQQVLKYHFPNAESHGDITKTDFTRYAGRIDLLTGGFPCQPFSTAGKRKGTEDERHLWPEMLRAIREIKPRFVVGENVGGFVSWDGGLVFEQVQADLEAEGYEVQAFILPACAVDAPHRRDRVWIVAYSNSCRNNRTKGSKESIWQYENKEQQRSGGAMQINRLSNERTIANSNGSSSGRIQRLCESGPGQPTQDIPDWRRFPTQPPVCSRNDGLSGGLAGITVSRHRRESIKAYGNAIVPQVAYQIIKAIDQLIFSP